MTLTGMLARKTPLILDSAMGTELQRLGVDCSPPLWSARAITAAPHIVRNIHYHNLLAGADILTANTFRTTPRASARAGTEGGWEEHAVQAIGAAHVARERHRSTRPVLIAASIAPLEDCYSPELTPPDAELEDEHGRIASTLALAGVDFLLIETMPTIREAATAARAAAATGLETAVSFVIGSDGRLLSGETIGDAVAAVLPYTPAAILVNCLPVAACLDALAALRAATPLPIGCHANTGDPTCVPATGIACGITPRDYGRAALLWRDAGASIIGGCCGTTPAHTRAVHDALFPDTGRPDPQQPFTPPPP